MNRLNYKYYLFKKFFSEKFFLQFLEENHYRDKIIETIFSDEFIKNSNSYKAINNVIRKILDSDETINRLVNDVSFSMILKEKLFSENNLKKILYDLNFFHDLIKTIYSDNFMHRIIMNIPKYKKSHLWLIAAPKSGSTWLTEIFRGILLDWEVNNLVVSHGRREQEINLHRLITSDTKKNVFSIAQHCKYSEYTSLIIREKKIKTVLHVRNIFDTAISYYDHLNIESKIVPSAYMDEKNWTMLKKKDQIDFVIDLVIPWYCNFYAGWFSSDLMQEGLIYLSSFEKLTIDTANHIENIFNWMNYKNIDKNMIKKAIENCKEKNTRKNIGVPGRGDSELSKKQKQRIRHYFKKYYPEIDFSCIGIS